MELISARKYVRYTIPTKGGLDHSNTNYYCS